MYQITATSPVGEVRIITETELTPEQARRRIMAVICRRYAEANREQLRKRSSPFGSAYSADLYDRVADWHDACAQPTR